jgi:hypothetical protein
VCDNSGMTQIEIPIQNGQTLVIVTDDSGTGAATLRIAKNGHNRGIAKLTADQAERIADVLYPYHRDADTALLA